jgi:VRR-NUC domain
MARKRCPETAIHCTVVQHLNIRGVPGLIFFHVPNGGYRNKSEAVLLKAMGVRAGVSDLILFHSGRLYCLEIKAKGGRASEEQLAFISDIDRAGAYTALATGLDACLATLEAWGLLRGSSVNEVLRITAERAEAAQ